MAKLAHGGFAKLFVVVASHHAGLGCGWSKAEIEGRHCMDLVGESKCGGQQVVKS